MLNIFFSITFRNIRVSSDLFQASKYFIHSSFGINILSYQFKLILKMIIKRTYSVIFNQSGQKEGLPKEIILGVVIKKNCT